MIQNIAELSPKEKVKTTLRDKLIVSRTFFPKEGGIEEYVYNRCLQDSEQIIVATPSLSGDKEFDRIQKFPIYRWYVPSFLTGGLIAGIVKQIFTLIGSFLLGLKLYFRYRYSFIEWGHGYDFPSILLLSYILPIRFFIYLHGDDILCPLRNPLLRKLFELTLQRASGISCNSHFTRDYLRTNFQFDTPTYIIHPTVRTEKFGEKLSQSTSEQLRLQIRQKYDIPQNAIVILSVGRLVKRKGFHRIVENLPLLLQKSLDVHYIICGRGGMETELKNMVKHLNLEDKVHFTGFVPDKELNAYYAASDIFAMLTFFDSKAASIEGFGIVYLEAGYFGKPAIASAVGGVVDAVKQGENGILVNPNSGYEILEGLTRLCEDKELRERLGNKGRELAQRQTPHRVMYQ
ncbi:MAG: glycosyltransferase family 4 protein [Mastigocoleus sp.]